MFKKKGMFVLLNKGISCYKFSIHFARSGAQNFLHINVLGFCYSGVPGIMVCVHCTLVN